MPVTAKLSRKFYDRLGDDITHELVDWFNTVDESCRADLRATNELLFARFEAKLEQRLGEVKADLMKWMFGLWATQMVAMAGMFLTVWLRDR
jgi:hypothetical protein